MPDQSEAARAANVLGALSLVVTDMTTAAVAAASGLSPSAAAALSALDQFLDKPTLDDLRQVLGLTPSGAVRLVDRLAADGLVRRAAGADGRRRAVLLTAEGRRTATLVAAARADVLDRLLSALPATERAAAAAGLDALMTAAVETKDGGAWTCRLCDLDRCQRAAGRCPAANAAARRYGAEAAGLPDGLAGPGGRGASDPA